ncbi:hypothetical protein NUACC26_045820 [Scytonema sp. NUACC26]
MKSPDYTAKYLSKAFADNSSKQVHRYYRSIVFGICKPIVAYILILPNTKSIYLYVRYKNIKIT